MHSHVFDLAGVCTGDGPCDVTSRDRSPKQNWIEKAGGTPAYIRAIRNALLRQGHSMGKATALAVGTVKNWASGQGNVSPATRVRAAAALAEWEAKKARAHSMSSTTGGVDLAARWKHGWIPLNAEAVATRKRWEREGRLPRDAAPHRDRSGRSLNADADRARVPSGRDRSGRGLTPNGGGREREVAEINRGTDELRPKKNADGVTTFLVADGSGKRVTRAEAAAQMFGTGSPKHKQAIEMDRREAAGLNPKLPKKKTPAKKAAPKAKATKPLPDVDALLRRDAADPRNAARSREAAILRSGRGRSVPLSAEGTSFDMASCPNCHTRLTVDLASGEPPNQTKTARKRPGDKFQGEGNPGMKAQAQAAGGGNSGFNESAHPRAGAGSPTGGQFIAAGSGGDNASQDETDQITGVEREIGVEADGVFSAADAEALKSWQRKQGLVADGKVGQQTASRMSDGPDVGPGSLRDVDRGYLSRRGSASGARPSDGRRRNGTPADNTTTRSLSARSRSVDLAADPMLRAAAAYRQMADPKKRKRLKAAMLAARMGR